MAKKIKKYKVGTDSETYAISMVEMPAIESDFVALSKEEDEKLQVFLESDERHMCYGAALIPDKDIYRNNGEQEFYISFTKESIEKMSQDFMKNYRQNEVTLDHDEMANDITITESWLVEDPYKDKANALGINVPKGTWMIGMKVNQIDVWERVKAGELKGFSVESMISLEDFSKQNDNNMEIETNEMFWSKLKNVMKEIFTSDKSEADIETSEGMKITAESALKEWEKLSNESIEEVWSRPYPLSALTDPINIELANMSGFTSVEAYLNEVAAIQTELEEQKQAEEAPKVEEPVVEEAPKVEEPTVEEPKPQETVDEKPKEDISKLEELIGNLKNEIEALKTMNSGLEEKVKEMSKQPSTEPIKPNAKPSASDTYSAWREQMRSMIG